MSVSVVVGGQFGSEGKGKAALYFAKKFRASAVVRVGGINSGHKSVASDGFEHTFKVLPTAALDSNILCILPSGCYISTDILFEEISRSNIERGRLIIDPYAVIIDEQMRLEEANSGLRETIGSTLSGTGAAVLRRISRNGPIVFAKDVEKLKPFVGDTKTVMRAMLACNNNIIVEGTQGFGLSPINSAYHPYVTSRDTTAAAFVAEAGLSPLDVSNVILVIRSFPIRVGGNSGPLPNETDWRSIAKSAGTEKDLTEYTSVTNRIRRVAEFDDDVVIRAVQVNRPNIIVMNHVDLIDYSCHNREELSDRADNFVHLAGDMIGHDINYVGTGPSTLFEWQSGSADFIERSR
jgi:adenylosuccinate synthase